MKKLIISIFIILLLIGGAACFTTAAGEDNSSQIDNIESCLLGLLNAAGNENIMIYDSSELTADILENRHGTMIVERCLGVVTNAEQGDGVVLNPADINYNYIGYRGISWPLSDGTVLLSYMVYNPNSNYIDDIVERYDFVLDVEWGRLSEICTSFAE